MVTPVPLSSAVLRVLNVMLLAFRADTCSTLSVFWLELPHRRVTRGGWPVLKALMGEDCHCMAQYSMSDSSSGVTVRVVLTSRGLMPAGASAHRGQDLYRDTPAR
jgi:hypothetical protein